MHKKRFILLIPLLIMVTLGISMGPGLINSYLKKDLLESKSYWTYIEPENQEITDAELAQYFVNNGFGDGATYSNGYNDADELNIEAINEQAKTVLSKVFGEDEAVLKKIESLVDSQLAYYERNIILTVIGSRTMSLVFVNLIYNNDSEEIEIVYEEKTSTVMSVTYQMWEPEKVDWYFIDSIFHSTEIYSEDILGLNKNQYKTWFDGEDYGVVASFSVQQHMESEKQVEEIEGIY